MFLCSHLYFCGNLFHLSVLEQGDIFNQDFHTSSLGNNLQKSEALFFMNYLFIIYVYRVRKTCVFNNYLCPTNTDLPLMTITSQ